MKSFVPCNEPDSWKFFCGKEYARDLSCCGKEYRPESSFWNLRQGMGIRVFHLRLGMGFGEVDGWKGGTEPLIDSPAFVQAWKERKVEKTLHAIWVIHHRQCYFHFIGAGCVGSKNQLWQVASDPPTYEWWTWEWQLASSDGLRVC